MVTCGVYFKYLATKPWNLLGLVNFDITVIVTSRHSRHLSNHSTINKHCYSRIYVNIIVIRGPFDIIVLASSTLIQLLWFHIQYTKSLRQPTCLSTRELCFAIPHPWQCHTNSWISAIASFCTLWHCYKISVQKTKVGYCHTTATISVKASIVKWMVTKN